MNEATQHPIRANGPDLDLGSLMDRLRSQAAQRRAAAPIGGAAETAAFNWPHVQARLKHAVRLAPAPTAVPGLGRLRGPVRRLAQLVLRGFLVLARVITVRQGELNGLLVEALRETAEGLRDLEMLVARQGARLRRLETDPRHAEASAACPAGKGVPDDRRPPLAA